MGNVARKEICRHEFFQCRVGTGTGIDTMYHYRLRVKMDQHLVKEKKLF